ETCFIFLPLGPKSPPGKPDPKPAPTDPPPPPAKTAGGDYDSYDYYYHYYSRSNGSFPTSVPTSAILSGNSFPTENPWRLSTDGSFLLVVPATPPPRPPVKPDPQLPHPPLKPGPAPKPIPTSSSPTVSPTSVALPGKG